MVSAVLRCSPRSRRHIRPSTCAWERSTRERLRTNSLGKCSMHDFRCWSQKRKWVSIASAEGDASPAEGNTAAEADPSDKEANSFNSCAYEKKKKPKHTICDYPGYEGNEMPLKRATKMKFSQGGSKAPERMCRVMNQLKAGTRAGSAADPVGIDEERAAGVQANIDPLFLIANSDAGITCVVVVPRPFSIGAENNLLAISERELSDAKCTVHAHILVPPVDDDGLKVLLGKHRYFSEIVGLFPSVACRMLNPGIVRDQSGRSVWSIPIEELEVLLDVHGPPPRVLVMGHTSTAAEMSCSSLQAPKTALHAS